MKLRKTFSLVTSLALLSALLTPAASHAENLILPRTNWLPCIVESQEFCIESVSIEDLQHPVAPIPLTYVRNNEELTPPEGFEPVPDEFRDPVGEGRLLNGMWTTPTWTQDTVALPGFDGLAVDFSTANEFTNHLFFRVLPAVNNENNVKLLATNPNNQAYPADLPLDWAVTVKVRMVGVESDLSITYGNGMSISRDGDVMTIRGAAVSIPQFSKASQCEGETGVASAVVKTIQGLVLVGNDGMGFGIPGLSGRMTVSSNGTCGTSTPSWNSSTETLEWTVAAPHFAPDGQTLNKGFYVAKIPAEDARLLWGIVDPVAVADKALTISVLDENGKAVVAIPKIGYQQGNIVIDYTGFEYSAKTVKITKNKAFSGFARKQTLTCTNWETGKKETRVGVYGCPPKPQAAVVQSSLTKFTGSASTLGTSRQAAISKLMLANTETQKFICTGIYKNGASAAQKTLARKRAKAACEFAKSKDPGLSYWYQTKGTAADSYAGKVLLTLKRNS